MTKIFKILGRIAGISCEWMLILLIFFAFLLRTSTFQTFLAQKVAHFLSTELDATIRINQVDIVFIDRLILDGVLLKGRQNDTIASIQHLMVNLDQIDLVHQKIALDHAELTKGNIYLSRDEKTGDYNYQFLVDYFSTGKKKKKSKPFTLSLASIQLNDIHFKLDDNRKVPTASGMDYAHLDIDHIYLNANRLSIVKDVIQANIVQLKAREKCGFHLTNFSCKAKVSPTKLHLEELKINTPFSAILMDRMHFNMPSYSGYLDFIDSVSIDAKIKKSKVSMRDIAQFATVLKGMDEVVTIEASVSECVKNLKIDELTLRVKEKTTVKGCIQLPDFRQFDRAYFNERIDYAYLHLAEIQKIKLPYKSGLTFLKLNEYLDRFSFLEPKRFRLSGTKNNFVVKAASCASGIGSITLVQGIHFTRDEKQQAFLIQTGDSLVNSIGINDFNLAQYIENDDFGFVNGELRLLARIFDNGEVSLEQINGQLSQFDYMRYPYSSIAIKDASYINNTVDGQLHINDKNIAMTYDGSIDLKGDRHMDMQIELQHAFLHPLHFTQSDSTLLNTSFNLNVYGKSLNEMYGEINLNNLHYNEGKQKIDLPSLTLKVSRLTAVDKFELTSGIANASLEGKIDFSTIGNDLTEQFQRIFPAIIAEKNTHKKKKPRFENNFSYTIEVFDASEFLAIFSPELVVSKGTKLKGAFDKKKELFTMDLTSKEITYQAIRFQAVDFNQKFDQLNIVADYKVGQLALNDSIQLETVHFTATGAQNTLNSELSWNPNSSNESKINWTTQLVHANHIDFKIHPSYFSINEQRWYTAKESELEFADEIIKITDLKLERKKQYILIDGLVSNADSNQLNFTVSNLDLSELSEFLGTEMQMKGILNSSGYIANPYHDLYYKGDAKITGFYLNNQEIGNIDATTEWIRATKSIGLIGDLNYRGNKTFHFDGSYAFNKEKDNLDFNLLFDKTDIQFTNAFMDADVVNSIKGQLNGSMKVTGTPELPILDGIIDLDAASAKIELLGVKLGLDGKIKADAYGFYIDNMPVIDEEGNRGAMIGSIYHSNFKNWNFDLQFDLEPRYSTLQTSNALPQNSTSDKFLLLNTTYKEGEMYFGKAYVSGNANIFGYADNIEITVDLQTRRGTRIQFPMYGSSEIKGENNFITFKKTGQVADSIEQNIDFTGVALNLNFRVIPDAEIKVIFNDQTGDEITAFGSGDIALTLDNLGEFKMDGTYRVKQGIYNFAMGPVIKQPFYIQEGGTIAWTGDPLNATVDIQTYYEVFANISEISPDQLQQNSKSTNQKILCYLNLTESLLKPTIGFDIKAPKADETGKALLARVNGEPDELNRQFFSLLLWKKFQPLRGTTAAGGSAAMDLVSNQINSLLSQVSQDYKMKLNMDKDELTKESTYEFGVSKGFLDNRLIITGSFGVESTGSQNKNGSQTQTQNALIGDVSLEYLLNESGTFRINVFNESNDYSIIQDKNLGLFTQGAGLHYQEDFDNFDNFKLAQYFLDIFRKKSNKRYPTKKKKRQTAVP